MSSTKTVRLERQSPGLNSFHEACSPATLGKALSGATDYPGPVIQFSHQSATFIEYLAFFPLGLWYIVMNTAYKHAFKDIILKLVWAKYKQADRWVDR